MATSKFNLLDFAAQKSNIAGGSLAVAAMLGGMTLHIASLPLWGMAAGSYLAGYLMLSQPKQSISIETADSAVEVKTIQANISKLRADIQNHSNRIPDEIMAASETIFDTLEEIVPRWQEINSFSDQKYVINSIITDYFPNSITNYMNLPKSYYRKGVKNQAADEITEQLDIMLKALEKIRDSLYAGVEQDIKTQSRFLKDRFVTSEESSSLRLK